MYRFIVSLILITCTEKLILHEGNNMGSFLMKERVSILLIYFRQENQVISWAWMTLSTQL